MFDLHKTKDTARPLTRRFGSFVAAVAVTFAAGSSALAADADGPLADAVVNKYDEIPVDLLAQYYEQADTTEPQWTPGGGVFQFFHGALGPGAIYAGPRRDGAFAYLIYGNILVAWGSYGYENGSGYPITEEKDSWPGSACSHHSTAVTRQQSFRDSEGRIWNYCVRPSDGHVSAFWDYVP